MFETIFKYPLEEFARGAIRFGTNLRPELALLAVAVAATAAVLAYRRAPKSVGRNRRACLSALRGLVLGLLALILFEPVLRIPMPITRDCFVAVLVDDSRSMTIADAGEQGARTAKAKRKTRLDAARALLGSPGKAKDFNDRGLLDRLTEVCPVTLFRFASEAERIDGPKEIRGSGDRTNLYAALQAVDAELRGVPLVGVVVLTDGAANVGGAPQQMARVLRMKARPVYFVGLGDPNPPNDYEVLSVQAPREVRRNSNVEIYASVRATGFTEAFDVVLHKADGTEALDTVSVQPAKDVEIHRVSLRFSPDDKGKLRYVVEILPAPEEVITDNNRREFAVEVTDKRLPVLYLEGSPREEYRFLRRALFRDKDFRVVGILRLDGPKKYLLQGAEPEDGLEQAPDRRSPKYKTVNGYPTDLKHLYRFHAVIFGDIEAGYLTQDQLKITERFVKEGGRGFCMLGGVNSFNLGKYQTTPIADLMPVELPSPRAAYQQREFKIALTKTGERHPIMRQNSNLFVNRNIWSKAPTLVGLNPIMKVKRGAQTLAYEPKNLHPLVVVQNYGAGRSAAFTTGGSWHWRMAVDVKNELHERFWKQLVRWLAVRTKGRIAIELDKDLFARKEPVSIQTMVLDEELQPINDAEVVAKITDPYNNVTTLTQRWILSRGGVYQAQYEPLETGDYQIQVTAKLKDADAPPLEASARFTVGQTMDEFVDAGQKVAMLKEVAGISGGRYITSREELWKVPDELMERLRTMKRDQTVFEQHDIWDTPLIFGIIALALSVEWFLRRRSGLM